jgi:DNA (cytosine-5)-methyltransferase 1
MGKALGLSRATITHRPNGMKGHQPISASRPAPTILAGSHCETGFRVSGAAADLAGTAPKLLDLPASTVLARAAKGYSGGLARGRGIGGASDSLYLATGRRQLTVKECAILQAFPDDHPWQGTKTAQYRQVGNAVPPTLAEAVARQVVEADKAPPNPRPVEG